MPPAAPFHVPARRGKKNRSGRGKSVSYGQVQAGLRRPDSSMFSNGNLKTPQILNSQLSISRRPAPAMLKESLR
jgi:hypothetical protein